MQSSKLWKCGLKYLGVVYRLSNTRANWRHGGRSSKKASRGLRAIASRARPPRRSGGATAHARSAPRRARRQGRDQRYLVRMDRAGPRRTCLDPRAVPTGRSAATFVRGQGSAFCPCRQVGPCENRASASCERPCLAGVRRRRVRSSGLRPGSAVERLLLERRGGEAISGVA